MRGTVNHGASNVMRSVRLYALIRIAFGVAAVVVPKTTGRAIAGDGEAGDSAAPLAKAFLRGMGGREIGLGLGLVTALRTGRALRPWLIVGALADTVDTAALGVASWRHSTPAKRALVLGVPALTALAAAGLASRVPPTF